MLKRIFLLSLGLWLMAAGALAAQASPCHVQAETAAALSITAPEASHTHCDMMGEAPAPTQAPSETPDKAPMAEGICCCPAVLAALPAPAAPDASSVAFRPPASFPLTARAASQTLIPEPPPPKA